MIFPNNDRMKEKKNSNLVFEVFMFIFGVLERKTEEEILTEWILIKLATFSNLWMVEFMSKWVVIIEKEGNEGLASKKERSGQLIGKALQQRIFPQSANCDIGTRARLRF